MIRLPSRGALERTEVVRRASSEVKGPKNDNPSRHTDQGPLLCVPFHYTPEDQTPWALEVTRQVQGNKRDDLVGSTDVHLYLRWT